jgi:F-type H+-transporting ATPase subunit c
MNETGERSYRYGRMKKERTLELAMILPLLAFTDAGLKYIGAGMVLGLGGLGPALAIGMLTGKAMEALGRNPEAVSVIQTNMILGIAFAEAIAIYALVVAVMIGFVF